MDKEINFAVWFYSDDESKDLFKSQVESFFVSCIDENFKCEFLSGEVKKLASEFAYQETLYVWNISILCLQLNKESEVQTYINKICKNWCDFSENKIFLCWLMPMTHTYPYLHDSRINDKLIKCVEFAFGTMPDLEHFVSHYHYKEKSVTSELMCSSYHSQQYFVLYFTPTHTLCCPAQRKSYVFKFKYKSLSRIIINVSNHDNKPTEIYFVYEYPAEVFVKIEDEMHTRDCAIAGPGQDEYTFGRYERTLEVGCECKKSFCDIKKFGRSSVLKIVMFDKYRTNRVIHNMIQRCGSKISFFYAGIKTMFVDFSRNIKSFPVYRSKEADKQNENSVVFDCEYAWKTVFCFSLYVRDQILLHERLTKQDAIMIVQRNLKKYALVNSTALCKALYVISEMVTKNKIFVFVRALNFFFKHFCTVKGTDYVPQGMCLIRRIVCTPSRTLFLPPMEHFENRVIRQFGAEFMLRLSIQDDNYSSLTFAIQNHTNKEEFIDRVLKHHLIDGFRIGNRHFTVLASSNSQLRGHGLWLYAKDNAGISADDIRIWMGDFHKIKNVAKCMARMGQCFSTSDSVQITLSACNEISLEDVKSSDGHYIFSDGIGTISSELADKVRQALRKNAEANSCSTYEPCAFQIRFKGCKGMVVEDKNLEGCRLGIRPSMKKFECKTSSSLEIIKVSKPRQLFLNRHLITILEQMGVSSSVFVELQEKMILDLLNSMIDEKSAISTLRRFFTSEFSYDALYSSGFSFINDAFFRSLLLSYLKSSFELLKQKTRISVPFDYGRNMFGVMDESGTLKYGQVFVQYSESHTSCKSKLKTLIGPVLVTKNPCMHPGDVRKFEAVNVECLKHIKDCIVFPSRGKRPHPDEMAGSDLDGDEFVVIWYKDLIFCKQNYPPMNYPIYKEITFDRSIDVMDMINFLCEYIMNDNIGTFGNAFLAWADQHPQGIFSKSCLSIAKKYPYVLDFAKTGTTQKLKYEEKPQKYPDFMEKFNLNCSYYSTKVLGVLYRATRLLKESVNRIDISHLSSCFDSCLCFPDWEDYQSSAISHLSSYTFLVENILHKFGFETEACAFSGCHQGYAYCQNRYEKINAETLVKKYLCNLMDMYRSKFFKEVDEENIANTSRSEEDKKRHMYRRASAWYMVVYKDNDSTVRSMPWAIGDVLCEVRKECGTKNKVINDSVFMRNADEVLKVKFLSERSSNDVCCDVIQHCCKILEIWIQKLCKEISENVSDVMKCFSKVFDDFLVTAGISHCSNLSYSPQAVLKLVIEFLKFSFSCPYVTCDKYYLMLQSFSLQTLTNLVVTQNVKYLGFECPIFSDDIIDNSNNSELIGETILVGVDSKLTQSFFENYLEKVKAHLCVTAGVKKVFITTECGRNEKCFLSISSVGKSWQQHKLQDIVLDVDFFKKMENLLRSQPMPRFCSNT